MGKLEFCTPMLGRRGFLWSCAVLSAGGVAFGLPGSIVARQPAGKTEFVVINGWVVPTQYLRKEQT